MVDRVMFSSDSTEWETPDWVFENLDKEFNFRLDVCATEKNAKCKNFLSKSDNALLTMWKGSCFMNPPYGKDLYAWVQKAWDMACNGATVVCLLPSRTDTRWFHDFCLKSNDIRFIKGRLKFKGAKNAAPFPSIIVVFSPDTLIWEQEKE